MPLHKVTMVTPTTPTYSSLFTHFLLGQDGPSQLPGWGNTLLGDHGQMATNRKWHNKTQMKAGKINVQQSHHYQLPYKKERSTSQNVVRMR